MDKTYQNLPRRKSQSHSKKSQNNYTKQRTICQNNSNNDIGQVKLEIKVDFKKSKTMKSTDMKIKMNIEYKDNNENQYKYDSNNNKDLHQPSYSFNNQSIIHNLLRKNFIDMFKNSSRVTSKSKIKRNNTNKTKSKNHKDINFSNNGNNNINLNNINYRVSNTVNSSFNFLNNHIIDRSINDSISSSLLFEDSPKIINKNSKRLIENKNLNKNNINDDVNIIDFEGNLITFNNNDHVNTGIIKQKTVNFNNYNNSKQRIIKKSTIKIKDLPPHEKVIIETDDDNDVDVDVDNIQSNIEGSNSDRKDTESSIKTKKLSCFSISNNYKNNIIQDFRLYSSKYLNNISTNKDMMEIKDTFTDKDKGNLDINTLNIDSCNKAKQMDIKSFNSNELFVTNKSINTNKSNNNDNSKLNKMLKSPASKSWNVLLNIGQVINKLNKIEARNISNLEELDQEFLAFKERKKRSLRNSFINPSINVKFDNLKAFEKISKNSNIYKEDKEGNMKYNCNNKNYNINNEQKNISIRDNKDHVNSNNNNSNKINIVSKKFNNISNNSINNINNINNINKDFSLKGRINDTILNIDYKKKDYNDNFYQIKTENTEQAINNIYKTNKIYDYICQGAPEDLVKVIKYYKNDTKRNLFTEKAYYKINEKLSQGFYALHLATINGHLEYVKELIKLDADYLIKSNNESVLDYSIRWNHVNIFDYLINNFDWPYSYLIEGKKIYERYKPNKTIKEKLMFKIKKAKKNSCYCV